MPGSSLLALIDDIATLLDDVAVMSKVAVKKTAGVLGDDLALNAEQVTGLTAERELPVVWAVAKGSLVNKAILVPAALGTSLVVPQAITSLLMLGGLFLCFEGVEKLAHKWGPHRAEAEAHHAELVEAVTNPSTDMVAFEKRKIRGAVRTDLILSAEIIVITLGTVASADFTKQVLVLSSVALAMTVGVYGLVAGIVKLDDLGLYLGGDAGRGGFGRFKRMAGRAILAAAPKLMKLLSVAGTLAMFMVGGGILVHGVPPVHHAVDLVTGRMVELPLFGSALSAVVGTLLEALFGVASGAVVLGVVELVKRMRPTRAAQR